MNTHIHSTLGIGTAGMMRWIRHRRSESAISSGPATTRRPFLGAIAVALSLMIVAGGAATALAQSREPRVNYVDIEAFPTIVDARHANKEAVDLFNRFFATKSRHDSDATMEFISRDLSVYADVTLGWELNGYDALKEVWAKYMPTWGEGRSYPTRILGEVNGGSGSVMLEFTDTPELFGADMRVLGTVDVVDGKITRWADYWDSATYDGKRFEKLKQTPVDPPPALRSKPAVTSARIRDVASKFVEMVSSGNTAGAATLFSYDGVFEDRSLNTTIAGTPAINRYLARANPKSPFGRGVKLGHVVGGNAGGGFEWVSPSSPVKTGAASLSINTEGKITRVSIIYDSRNLSATNRSDLAALALEPLQ
jgi:limonene-1,2-epoxide hydrolase